MKCHQRDVEFFLIFNFQTKTVTIGGFHSFKGPFIFYEVWGAGGIF